VVCAGKLRGDSKGYYATCWDIETGAATVEKTTVTLADRPSFDAVAEDWVASTVYKWSCLEGKLWVFLDLDGCFAKLKRRLIWNVRTGEDVVSWNPAEQKVEMPGSVHKPVSEASAFTLSSKRNFMAEGGSGRVQVYRLQ
jgi:hypothetical protein